MSRPLALAALIALGVATLAQAVAAQDYEIKMDRPHKVGDEYAFTSKGQSDDSSTITLGEKKVSDETKGFSYEIEARAKVLEVNEVGSPRKLSLTITKCTRTEGGKTVRIVEKSKTVVVFRKDKQTVFEQDGQPLAGPLAEVLEDVGPIGTGSATNDEIFGTKERKRVGDHWPMNVEAAAKDLETKTLRIAKEDVSGTTTLERVVKVGGVDCLVLKGVISVTRFDAKMPPGFKIDSGTVQAENTVTTPVAPTLHDVEEVSQMTARFVAIGNPDPAGPGAKMVAVMNRKKTTRYTYPKPTAKEK
jgi:hypothetical protein